MIVSLLIRRSLPFAALALLTAASSHASVARAVGFQEKVEAADAIVLGKVVSSESQWDPSHRWIVTRSTFDVEKALKGTPAPQLTLITPGGSVDGVRQETIGIPSFKPGDEHVVFVRSTTAGPTVAFFEQGVFDVNRDDRGRVLVEAASSELVLLDQSSGRAIAADSSAQTLDAFERKIASAVRTAQNRRNQMGAGAAHPPTEGELTRFARDHRLLLLLGGLAAALALAVIVYKRP